MITDFPFKEIDAEGLETLLAISKADRFNRWMYETIKPFVTGNILEIGSGIGNISNYFLDDHQQITISDIRENYLDFSRNEFQSYSNLKGIVNIDLMDENFDKKHASLLNTFDSVFALNVIEHIEHDALAIANCKKLLKPGGTLLILVPAFQSIYNSLDTELFHYRRYTRKMLEQRIRQSNMIIKKSFYFNALGIPAWVWGGMISKSKTISSGQMNIYNKLVRIAKLIDQLVFNQMGLSVVAVARKE